MIDIILTNDALRAQLVKTQSRRLSDFDVTLHFERLLQIISDVAAM